MKTTLIAIIGAAVFALTMVCNSLSWAGSVNTPQVVLTSSGASGSTVGARYSNDTVQSISCNHAAYATYEFVACSARDKTWQFRSCLSSNSRLFPPLRTLTEASYIAFESDSRGHCTSIQIDNYSFRLR